MGAGVTKPWWQQERAEARRKLEETTEGRRLIAEAEAALAQGQARGGGSAWQKAFAASQAVLQAQLAAERKRGLIVLPLEEALRTHESLVRAHWPRLTENLAQVFTLAFWRHGTFIYVPHGLTVETQLAPWPATDFAGEVFSLQLVVLEKHAQASVLSGCVQAKPNLGSLRAASWQLSVGEGAALEWVTLDNFTGMADAAMRRFQVAGSGRLTWRLLRLADPGARFPVDLAGPLRCEGLSVPQADVFGPIAVCGQGPVSGEVLVWESTATGYHASSLEGEHIPWRPISQRTEALGVLGAFPMEYAIEAEMALDKMI